jgi:hypothetical protein
MKLHILLAVVLLAAPSARAKDHINLQWSICDLNPQNVPQKLGEDITDPYKQNPIIYYDTRPPVYTFQGLMFRTKTNKGQEISRVKVRFRRASLNVPDSFSCAWDRYGDKISYTCEKRYPLHRNIQRFFLLL